MSTLSTLLPLIAENPLIQSRAAGDIMSQQQGLTSVLNQQRLQQQQMQQNQINLDDQKSMSEAMRQWDGKDINDIPGLGIKNGASASAVLGMKQHIAEFAKQQADTALAQGQAGKVALDNQLQRHQNVYDAMTNVPIKSKDGSLNVDATSQALDALSHNGEFLGNLTDQEKAQLPQVITQAKAKLASDPEGFLDDWTTTAKGHLAQSQQYKMASDQLDERTRQLTNTKTEQETTNTAAHIAAGRQHIAANPVTDGHPTTMDDYETALAEQKGKAEAKGKLEGEQAAAGGGAVAGVPLDTQEANAWLKAHPTTNGHPSTLADFKEWSAKLVPGYTFNLQSGAGLTPVALDQAAEKYSATGELPAMGMGAAGAVTRRQIMDRAAELHPNGSLAANSAAFKANQDSLKSLQKNFDQVTAFENTAGKNLDQFLTTAQKVADSGSAWVNTPLRSVNRGMLGSADQAAFDAARATALTEISKVLNSSNASGVLSDSARQEVSSLIGPGATLGQIMSAANILKTDMANRHQSYQEQIQDIQSRLGGAPGATTTGGAGKTGAPALRVGQNVSIKGKQMTITSVHPDGTFDAK